MKKADCSKLPKFPTRPSPRSRATRLCRIEKKKEKRKKKDWALLYERYGAAGRSDCGVKNPGCSGTVAFKMPHHKPTQRRGQGRSWSKRWVKAHSSAAQRRLSPYSTARDALPSTYFCHGFSSGFIIRRRQAPNL
jgi:hypothetical protein